MRALSGSVFFLFVWMVVVAVVFLHLAHLILFNWNYALLFSFNKQTKNIGDTVTKAGLSLRWMLVFQGPGQEISAN